jgi:TolB-like protein
MKRRIVVILFSIMFVLMFQGVCAGFQKTKIAVLDFKVLGKGHADTEVGHVVANQLIDALEKDGRFEIVEPGLIEKVIREQQLVLDKKEHRLIITDSAKLLGAKVLISGFVMKYEDIIEVNVRVINIENASIIAAESAKSTDVDSLCRMVDQLVEKIINLFPFKGVVVFRKGDTITVDLGQCDGVKPDMYFAVFKECKAIKNPDTGRVIDFKRIQTGVFKIQDVKDKISTASISVEKISDPITNGQTIESAEGLLVPDGCR